MACPDGAGARHVRVVATGDVLGAAVRGALAALGWSVHGPVDDGPGAAPSGDTAPVVLVVGPDGRLPTRVHAPARRPYTVVVGTRAAWRACADAVARETVDDVVDAEQPLAELATLLDRTLCRRDGARRRVDLLANLRRRHDETTRFAHLTAREEEVLCDLVVGRTVTEIAASRPVSVTTVRSQVQAVLTKLGVTSQTAAVLMALRSGRGRRLDACLRDLRQF